MVAAVQLCQPRARFSFTADCGSQPEAKTSPCLVVLRVDIALLPQRRLSLQFNPQIQLQNLKLDQTRELREADEVVAIPIHRMGQAGRWHDERV